jgi:hypothetical protein
MFTRTEFSRPNGAAFCCGALYVGRVSCDNPLPFVLRPRVKKVVHDTGAAPGRAKAPCAVEKEIGLQAAL